MKRVFELIYTIWREVPMAERVDLSRDHRKGDVIAYRYRSTDLGEATVIGYIRMSYTGKVHTGLDEVPELFFVQERHVSLQDRPRLGVDLLARSQ